MVLSRAAIYGSLLSVGIVIGATWHTWTAPVVANGVALTQDDADRLYRELDGGEGSLLESSRLMAKIARVTTPSVVHIQSLHGTAGRAKIEETGSGVLVLCDRVPGTYVVTNRHVIAGATREDVTIHLYDGRVVRPDRIWTDKASDVAVLKISASDLHPARWGDSDRLDIGHLVMAMGSPFGLSQSVTLGIISAKGRRSLKLGADNSAVINQDFLQTDAAINPGNSGGPLIDMQGRIVGINTAIASNSGGNDGIGFSIPSNLARRVTEQLLEYGSVQRSYLGVKLDPHFDAEAARRFNLDRASGARVLEVYPGTPASEANLQFNDVILSFDGIDVLDENHLINLVSLRPVGTRVRVVVLRGGRRMTVNVLLADRVELDKRAEAASK